MSRTKIQLPADGLAGLKENLSRDALAGFLVFLLAMPLSLGIAKASGFPMIFGLVTAIVGGVIVSFFMGSRLSVKGPAAGLIVIASGSVTAFGDGETGWHLALGAIVAAALLQILFGVCRLGKLADFFPSAAIHGMLAAIGIIIMAKQLHLVLGINPAELKGKEPLELIALLPSSILHENAHLAEIGLACLMIMVLMSYVKHDKIKKIPAPLIVLAVSIPLGFALHIKTDGEISSYSLVKIGSITGAFHDGLIHADFSGLFRHTGVFIQYVILYALIGSLESLLTAKAVDGMDPYKRKTDYDKDLIAVGIGNILSGLLGGLPMISEVARSSANIGYGARTRWANFFHGVFLLLAVLIGVQFIEMIPNVALAAMLIFVGFRLAHPRQFIHAYHTGREQLAVFCVTILVTVSTDLLIGVGSGILLEMIINLVNGASFRNLFRSRLSTEALNGGLRVKVSGDLLFSNLPGFKRHLLALPGGQSIHIDMSETRVVDHTAMVLLQELAGSYKAEGRRLQIGGLENHRQLSKDPCSSRILKLN